MNISDHNDNDSPLATAVAGKSAPFFSIVMGCVEDDLTLKEVNEKNESATSEQYMETYPNTPCL